MSTEANGGPAPRGGIPHHEGVRSRRDFLLRAGGGFGAVALAGLLESEGVRAGGDAAASADPRPPMWPAPAKSVIFLFMEGGPSHIDLFDPKPKLNELAGKPLPPSFRPPRITAMGEIRSPLLECRRTWARHGESGTWVSDWLPHIAEHVDDIAVVRSCWCDGLNHVGSVCQMNTGSVLAGRPSLGSWAVYGLGSENRDLPSYVVLLDRDGTVAGGPRNWGTGFLPATYQGTRLRSKGAPIRHLAPPEGTTRERERRKLDLLGTLDRRHLAARPGHDDLEARIASYELAFRMQAEAPRAIDLSRETAAVRALYGLDEKPTHDMARACLLSRRLVERGVRFVQVYCGAGSKWDAHKGIEKNHSGLCRAMDKPVAGLLADLKSRGLLDETLVVWGGEFGRTPMSEKGTGRDHNPTGFTMWFAGGGVPGGKTIGATDEVGIHAVENPVHVHDLHATVLAQMGLNPRGLTYLDGGRLENPVQNEGAPIAELMG